MKNKKTRLQILSTKILTLLRKAGAITVSAGEIEKYQKALEKRKEGKKKNSK
jgi:hypothetical protein